MRLAKDHTFSSKRLRYRGISEADAELIVRWRSDPDNYRFFFSARPVTLDEHMQWYAAYLGDDSRYDFLILDKDQTAIGTVGLSNIDESGCEVSYIIGDKSARGKGYATEAVEAACKLAFDQLGITEVVARVMPSNEASAKTAQKAGFVESERVFTLRNRSAQ